MNAENELDELERRYNELVSHRRIEDSHAIYLVIQRMLELRRGLARKRGDEVAVPIEWPIPWATYGPIRAISASGVTAVVYKVATSPDRWDDKARYDCEIGDANPRVPPCAIASFSGSWASQFDRLNDEVIAAHPLRANGLDIGRAHLIENSRWVRDLQAISQSHRNFDPVVWRGAKHFWLSFKDGNFQCIAAGYQLRMVTGGYAAAAIEALAAPG